MKSEQEIRAMISRIQSLGDRAKEIYDQLGPVTALVFAENVAARLAKLQGIVPSLAWVVNPDTVNRHGCPEDWLTLEQLTDVLELHLSECSQIVNSNTGGLGR